MSVSPSVSRGSFGAGYDRARLPRWHQYANKNGFPKHDLRAVSARSVAQKVLLVDDHHESRHLLASALRRLAYHVVEATCGDEAMSMLDRGTSADVVITDMVMPGKVQGRDLADCVAARSPDVPVILMSGHFDTTKMHKKNLVMELPKPVSLATMAETVRKVLGGT